MKKIDVWRLPLDQIIPTLVSLREQGKNEEADELSKAIMTEIKNLEKEIKNINKELKEKHGFKG